MKKASLLSLTLLLMLTMLATACSGGTSNEPNNQANAGSGNEPQEEMITLKFWYPGTEDILTTAVKDIIQKFEDQNPNITVELTSIPWADYFQKLTVSYAGGLQPDVQGLGFGQLISTVNQGKYLDLNPYIEADNWEGKEDFFPDILKAGQYENGQYGLLMPEIRPLAYRKDFFTEAGLDPNNPPKTLDEIFEYAEKLKKVENGKTVRGGIDIQTSNGEQSYLSLLLLLGEDFYDEKGNPTFDSQTSIDLVQRMVDLYKSGAIIQANQQQVTGTPFQNSQAALAFISTSGAAALKQSVGADKIGWVLPPAGKDGKQTALMLGTFLTASQKSKHPEEAWKFIKFWFDKSNILDFTTKTGYIPPLQSVKADFVKLAPENEISFEALNDARGYGASGSWAINVKYLRLALEESYAGVRPVAEALKDNAAKAREELASAQ
ncbi:ABC transporter substrate-binding protein [Paenibacillus sepulcri]|uniref:ABC transporter substrate-binding protein n=1 Tax=Paenibacillus sepulcri TaxID=359917 RepID=A0ABS7C9W5_9BACL|nr:ABC transporter substrate-binding protein [Paenibacillus sepulcri]